MVSITATTFHVQGFTIDTVGNMGWGSTSVCIGLVDGLSKLTAVLYAEAAVPLHWWIVWGQVVLHATLAGCSRTCMLSMI